MPQEYRARLTGLVTLPEHAYLIAASATTPSDHTMLFLPPGSLPLRICEDSATADRHPDCIVELTMVDSRKGGGMARPEDTDARFERIESRLETLTRTVHEGFAGVDRAFAGIDQSFAGVDQAFADQRLYTDFAFDALRKEMHEGFGQVDRRFEQIDGRLEEMGGRIGQMGGQIGRLERKIDWLIESLSNRSS
jgi:hypothetical protein